MKIICSRDLLNESVAIVQKAVASRTTQKILEGILIEADGDLVLTGYNKQYGIECRMQADIPEQGSFVVMARMFGDIVRKLPGDIVTIEKKDSGSILIESGNSRFSINCLEADDFPQIPVVEEKEHVKIEQGVLKDMIHQTIFSVSSDETRPILNGCLIKTYDNTIELVAIDGFRLALRKHEFSFSAGALEFIIPGRILQEIGRILESSAETVQIYVSRNHALFTIDNIKIVSRLIEGEYMNYRGILPQTAESTMVVSTNAFLQAVERAALIIVSEENRFPVKLQLTDDDRLLISAKTDVGTLREELSASVKGEPLEIDFNPRYLIEALRVIDEDEIAISFNGSIGPSVIRPIEGDSFSYLVLPLRP